MLYVAEATFDGSVAAACSATIAPAPGEGFGVSATFVTAGPVASITRAAPVLHALVFGGLAPSVARTETVWVPGDSVGIVADSVLPETVIGCGVPVPSRLYWAETTPDGSVAVAVRAIGDVPFEGFGEPTIADTTGPAVSVVVPAVTAMNMSIPPKGLTPARLVFLPWLRTARLPSKIASLPPFGVAAGTCTIASAVCPGPKVSATARSGKGDGCPSLPTSVWFAPSTLSEW